MQKNKILSKKEIKNIRHMIKKQWNADIDLDYVFLINSKNRLFIAKKELFSIDDEKLRIDSIGLYFGTISNNHLRLSIEGSQMIGPYAKKNVIVIDDEQAKLWIRAQNLNTDKEDSSFLIIRSDNDFYGCGKIKDKILHNFYPKSRKIS